MKLNLHYLSLLAILAIGVYAIYLLTGYRQLQLLIGISLGVIYVIWGIIHHQKARDLHFRIVIEYVLIAVIAIVLMLTILI